MADEIYKVLIQDRTWSYSSLCTFCECPYRWYLKYLTYPKLKSQDKFYASYGLFMHELLEDFHKGESDRDELLERYYLCFNDKTQGTGRPKIDTVKKYLSAGADYISNMKPFDYKVLAIEDEIDFEIDGIKFTCRIDYTGEDENGDIVVIDHKSRDLKQRSGRANPTVKDKELDSMLKQLYLYSVAIKQKYGRFPKYLCFNCFKTGVFIKEEFDESKYNEAIKWAIDTVHKAENTEDFYPSIDFFSCYYICEMCHECMFDEISREERRRSRGKK